MWRAARYRLMALDPKGRRYEKARGSLIYLRLIAARARCMRGRQWIELNYEPATIDGPRCPSCHRLT